VIVMPAKVTSSSNRSKRSTNKPVTKGQNPQRANRQSVSQAKVTSGSNGKPAGSGTAKVTTGRGSALRNAAKVAQVAGAARNLTPATVAYETLKARPTAAGTVTAAQSGRAPSRFANARDVAMKKASAIKGSPVVGPKKSAAQKFDSAFAAAKKAGKKEFTWNGKKYNTKTK
jgi:hypothetical protein